MYTSDVAYEYYCPQRRDEMRDVILSASDPTCPALFREIISSRPYPNINRGRGLDDLMSIRTYRLLFVKIFLYSFSRPCYALLQTASLFFLAASLCSKLDMGSSGVWCLIRLAISIDRRDRACLKMAADFDFALEVDC